MTSIEFQQKLTAKYPKYLAEAKAELAEISEYLNTISTDDCGKLWAYFRDNYIEIATPRRAHFVTMGSKLGLASRRREVEIEYVCLICAARYPIDNKRQCPHCGNHDRTWTYVIPVGATRTKKLKAEEEKEREDALNERLGSHR